MSAPRRNTDGYGEKYSRILSTALRTTPYNSVQLRTTPYNSVQKKRANLPNPHAPRSVMRLPPSGSQNKKSLLIAPHPRPICPLCPRRPICPPKTKIPPHPRPICPLGPRRPICPSKTKIPLSCAGAQSALFSGGSISLRSFAARLQSSVFSLQPVLPQAELMGGSRYACRQWQTSEAQLSHRSRII